LKRRILEFEIPHIRFPEVEWEKIRIEIPEVEIPSLEEFKAECEGVGGRYEVQTIKKGELEMKIHSCVKEKKTGILIEFGGR